MKKQKLLKKTKAFIRRALALSLCLVCILSALPVYADNVTIGTYNGYEWTRIHSKSEFEKYASGAFTRSDQGPATGVETGSKIGDAALSDWFRILLIYNSDGNQYYVGGNSRCDDDEVFIGQRALGSYGIDTTKNSFRTISGLNAPYIKYSGYDGENNCNRYFLRFSKDDKLGDNIWAMYCKWYGIDLHAACECWFKNNVNKTRNSDYVNWWSDVCMQWSGDKVYFFYNVPNAHDRGWEIEDDGHIECTQDYDDSYFTVYIGKSVPGATITYPTTIDSGTTAIWSNHLIENNVTIEKDATLVVDGCCYNNSKITVNGGTLIIRGVLDSKTETKTSELDAQIGSIEVRNGTLLVEDTGTWLVRSYSPGFDFYDHSLIDIEGVAVLSNGFYAKDSDVRIGYHGMLAVGVRPNDTSQQSLYNKQWVCSNRSRYLSDLCVANALTGRPYPWPMTLEGTSSFQSQGAFFKQAKVSLAIRDTSYFSGRMTENINAAITDMAMHW